MPRLVLSTAVLAIAAFAASIALAATADSLRRVAALRAVSVWATEGGERKAPTAAETMVPLGDGVSLTTVVAAVGQLVE